MIKLQILVVFSFLYFFSFMECKSQILIIESGEGWKSKIDSALSIIKTYDTTKYNTLLNVCHEIGYCTDNSSTIEYPDVIILSTTDIKSGNINDIAAAIVHESRHLYIYQNNITLPYNKEEYLCYDYELRFLKRIPNVDNFLILNCKRMMSYFSTK
jgi:uncharacterized protein (DUF779 family)